VVVPTERQPSFEDLAPRVIFPGRLVPHLDGIGDELQLAAGYG
jgi:hypothetical protein